MAGRLAGSVLALALGAGLAGPAQAGSVEGRIVLGVEGASLESVGPLVVYLEPLGGVPSAAPGAEGPSIHQQNARFAPGFLAVAVGQPVEMPNDDEIYHNVFSYSTGNRFDLGLYASGESRTVTFWEPGVVKLYCSIHESMNATVYVAPTPLFAVVSHSGAFALRDVRPGRYRLGVWAERLPEASQEFTVAPGRTTSVEIAIGDS